jgi:hypothetical protein
VCDAFNLFIVLILFLLVKNGLLRLFAVPFDDPQPEAAQ